MNRYQRNLALLAVGCGFLVAAAGPVHAVVTHQFASFDEFDSTGAGATIGPFVDPLTGEAGYITTTGIVSGTLNTIGTAGSNGRLGITGGSSSTAFDDGESWTIEWSTISRFEGISFRQYTNSVEDFAFVVQSPAWVGLSITPGSSDVQFNSGLGEFSFSSLRLTNGPVTEIIYDITDLFGGAASPDILSNTSITFSYNSGVGETAGIASFSFGLGIPEPSTVVLLLGGGLLLWRQWRRRG